MKVINNVNTTMPQITAVSRCIVETHTNTISFSFHGLLGSRHDEVFIVYNGVFISPEKREVPVDLRNGSGMDFRQDFW